jgi:dihydrofolate reductase
MIRLIAAIDSRRGIATDSGIPWKLPGDSVYFREKTATGAILMGGATYLEFAAPLHGRENFVLTTRPEPLRAGFRAVGSLAVLATNQPGEDIWVLGGGKVYTETIDQAEELFLTQVVGDFHCTKFFPPYETEFRLATQADDREEGGITYRFETWQHVQSKPKDSAD